MRKNRGVEGNKSMAGKQKGLGRGLDALIKDGSESAVEQATAARGAGIEEVAISRISASPWQPRSVFKAEALIELVDSIKAHGILQPLIVRQVNDQYELIAGERRLRAAEAAELTQVPIRIIEATDEKALQFALIENLQREDLNPIEEAEGYALLQKKFGLTQEQVAAEVGKARASVANALRLLDLSDAIRKHVSDGLLSVGHAKALLALTSEGDREMLAKQAIKEGLTVRALERLVKRMALPPKKPRAEKSDLPTDYLKTLTDDLHKWFGTRVRVTPSKTLANGRKVKGSLEIDYHNNDELDRILQMMGYQSEL
jgi:ParB family chromosome partitioning protein